MAWDLAWTRLEDARTPDDGRCLGFRWSGPVRGLGSDGGEGWAARYRIDGTSEGETCLSTGDFHPTTGSLSWEATVSVMLGASTGSGSYTAGGMLRQHHAWSGRIRRSGGSS